MSFINELLSLGNTDINFKQYVKDQNLSIYQNGVITLEHFTDTMKKNIDYFKWYNDIKKNDKSNKKILPKSKYLFNDNVNLTSVLKLDLLQLPLLVNSNHQREVIALAPNADIPLAPNADIPLAPKADIPLAPKADIPLAPNADIPLAPKNIQQALHAEIQQQYNKLKHVELQPSQIINDPMNEINNKINNLKQLKNEDDEWDDDDWDDDRDDDNGNEEKIKVLTNEINNDQKKFYEQQLNDLKNQYSNLFSNNKLSLNNILKQYKESITNDIYKYLTNIFQYKNQEFLNKIKRYNPDDLLDIAKRLREQNK